MTQILLLESSSTNCSVGIAKNGIIICSKESNKGYTHSEHMAQFIADVLAEAEIGVSDLDAVAVGKGPGSYTGLRIGTSLAKGIAYGQTIPIISIDSLRNLAANVCQLDMDFDLIIPLIDARRMEVYTACYNRSLERLNDIEALILDEQSFSEYLSDNKVLFCGDGVAKFKEICQSSNALFVDDIFPSVNAMAPIAEEKFRKSEFEDSAYFEPFYLKEFIAIKPKKLF